MSEATTTKTTSASRISLTASVSDSLNTCGTVQISFLLASSDASDATDIPYTRVVARDRFSSHEFHKASTLDHCLCNAREFKRKRCALQRQPATGVRSHTARACRLLDRSSSE